MVSSTNSAYNLTIANTASPSYTLKLMSIVAVVLLPMVLAYTAWNYYVFRRRLTASDFQPPRPEPAGSPATADRAGRTPEPDRERAGSSGG
jgi:cytochrome d ubiquinol oxidase subunit II